MACIVIKRLLGYELCILEKEGTLFYSDPIVVIRKEGFTEIYKHCAREPLPMKSVVG